MLIRTLIAAVVVASAIFQVQTPAAQSWGLRVETVATPAAPNTAQPQLTVSGRGVLLSWVEQDGPTATLKFAERVNGSWAAPQSVASGKDWFINWADVPSVARLGDGSLVAHWLQKSGTGAYAYDVRLAHSTDDGKTWSQSYTPHHDGTQTEHGFATLFQAARGGLGLVWLDGRTTAGGAGHDSHASGGMTLRYAEFDRNWKQVAEAPLDTLVCDCCPTAVTVTSDGPLVAYRDRSEKEVRDIYVARLENGKWTTGVPLNRDNWRINACPVNGPSLSARGNTVVAAWFTGEGDKPRSYASFSKDAGRTFGKPARLDDQASLGRVDVEMLPDGSAVASYVEFSEQRAQFRVRRIQPDGTRSDAVSVAAISGTRSSGYPRMAFSDGELVFAWTDRDGGSQVRTAVAKLPQLKLDQAASR